MRVDGRDLPETTDTLNGNSLSSLGPRLNHTVVNSHTGT